MTSLRASWLALVPVVLFACGPDAAPSGRAESDSEPRWWWSGWRGPTRWPGETDVLGSAVSGP
jgi:hypothetical protein